MFVRFRQVGYRLQASLIETRRVAGKVRHEHIAMLGSIILPPSVADRITFWARLHERLAKLANRVTAEDHGKVLGAIHVRVPMVTPDEQRALQLENAKADARFWDNLAEMHGDVAQGHKGLIAVAERTVANSENAKAASAEHVAQAKDRIARIERGENVEGGLIRSEVNIEDILIEAGWTKEDLRRARQLGELKPVAFEEAKAEVMRRKDRAENAAIRAVHRKYFGSTSKV
jgi:hypothetical protein